LLYSTSDTILKKSLKIPKGQSESVYRKKNRQHNGLKKKDKRKTNDPQNTHIKPKIEQHEPHQNPGVNAGAPDG